MIDPKGEVCTSTSQGTPDLHGTDQPVGRETDEHLREDQQDAYPTWQKVQQKEKEKKLKAEGNIILRNASSSLKITTTTAAMILVD